MCVEIDSDLGGCALVWACLSLTPTVLSGRVCYLSGRRSWLLADIWISVEVSRCDSWINTGKAPCPTLTFAWAGRVRRPNAMLLSRYYLYHLWRTQGDRHEGSRALLFTFLIEIQCSVCSGGLCTQVRLEWPTDLAVNPLDNSLYILDNNIVLQVEADSSHTFASDWLPVQRYSRETVAL